MHIYQGIADLRAKNGLTRDQEAFSSVVTIGNFDGVHLGHQELLKAVVSEAQSLGITSVVYTFHPHPVKVLYPERKTERMFDLRDQQQQFEAFGIQNVIVENFTHDFSKIDPETFLNEYLYKPLKPKTLVVGHDFSFGSARAGNLHYLENFCREKGIKLIVIPPFQLNSLVVSSSKIRNELKLGDIEKARELLGRRYYLRGHVQTGFQRGRTIGVPTANLHPDVEFIPRKGVYVTLTTFGGKEYPSITNIGVNPTVTQGEGSPVKIETHIFDFNAQIYGLEIEVYLLHFLRDEKKFNSFEELKQQIQNDMQQAREFFNGKPS